MEKFEIRRLISLVSFSDSVQILYTIIVYNTIIVNESHCSHMERGPKFFKMGTKRGPSAAEKGTKRGLNWDLKSVYLIN